jgi:uncharacterized membrane protein YedE/YeeE
MPIFKMNIKDEYWRLIFIVGAMVGGFLTVTFLQSPAPVDISEATRMHLNDWGMNYPSTIEEGKGFIPDEIFNFGNLKGIILAIAGGFLVGFGARYGQGCTSGHAITGMAHLQLPSLVTVIGFFIGGLIMTHFFMPFIIG